MTIQTFVVTAVPNPIGSGAIYQIGGQNRPILNLFRGGVYTFDQSDATNITHQLAFKDSAGNSYTQGKVTTGTPGTPGAQVVLTVAANAPSNLRYYCVTHGNGMGNTITVSDAPAIQTVNLGTYANSSTGDDLRTAFEKVNANFAFLDLTSAVTADNIGAGARVFKEKLGDNLKLRTLVAGTGMTVVENSNDVTVTSVIDITRDTAPQLGGNLVLGGFDVTGTGNVNITGSITSTGDVAVNGGDLTTTAATFNLVNATATTVNLAAAADFLNIGKTTGLTTVAGELQVNDDVVITNDGRLKTTNSSAYVFNETANYVFIGQNAVRVDLGSVNGIVGLGHDGEVANDFTVLGTIYGNFDATQGTVDLLTVVNTLYANDISLSGNLSGNLVGNVTGNVTSTGASSFNTISATGVITGATVGNVIPFYYANQSAFPNPATYHGAIAHSHADGKMYFAHSGAWAALANASDAYVLPTATTAVLGGVRVDGTTITVSGGIISSTAGGGGGGNLDFGTFTAPAGFDLDMGTF